MAKIDELLKELCPEGVEYIKTGAACEIITDYVAAGSFAALRNKVTYLKGTGYAQLVRTSDLKQNFSNSEDFVYVSKEAFEFLWRVNLNTECIILPNVGINCGEVYYISPNLLNHKYNVLGPNAIKVESNQHNNRYLFFLFHTKYFQEEIRKITSSGGQPKFNKTKLKEILIPVPSISTQDKIVEVLDTFTDAISNLEEELALREKQFGFYREQLLSFDDEASLGGKLFSDKVKYVKLKDICLNICSGGTPLTSNKEYYSGSNPWLRTQEVDWNDVYDTELKISEDAIKNSSAKLIPANCLIVAMYGATAGKCCINRIPLTTNQACCNLQIDERQALVKYVFHWVCKEYHHIKAMGEGSQSNLNAQKVKSYPVPLPSISSQKEIAYTFQK